MKIKIFKTNEKNKIELTQEHLQKLIDEAYNEGYSDGQKRPYWWWYDTTTAPYKIQTLPSSNSDSSTTVVYSEGTPMTISRDSLLKSNQFYINTETWGDPK